MLRDSSDAARRLCLVLAASRFVGDLLEHLPRRYLPRGELSSFAELQARIDVLRRHSRAIQIAGGVAMVIVGLMLLTGAWNSFIGWTRQLVVGFGGTII